MINHLFQSKSEHLCKSPRVCVRICVQVAIHVCVCVCTWVHLLEGSEGWGTSSLMRKREIETVRFVSLRWTLETNVPKFIQWVLIGATSREGQAQASDGRVKRRRWNSVIVCLSLGMRKRKGNVEKRDKESRVRKMRKMTEKEKERER